MEITAAEDGSGTEDEKEIVTGKDETGGRDEAAWITTENEGGVMMEREIKDGDRPRRSERRERTTRWDSDDRLTELENTDRMRTSDSVGRPRVTPSLDTSRDLNMDPSQRNTESKSLAPKEDSNASAGPEPSAECKPSEEKQEKAS